MIDDPSNYSNRIQSQIDVYAAVEDMHARAPAADWVTLKYVNPRFKAVFGSDNLHEIYATYLSQAVERTGIDRVVSLGAGYGALEVSIMKYVTKNGLKPFHLVCTELSPILVERTRAGIAAAGFSDVMSAQVADLNRPFEIEGPVAAVMVHHALHHFVELEHIFAEIDLLLHPEGSFMTQDMIGRNGHMRWPESLSLVSELWDGLPDRYKRDHQRSKNQFRPYYANWDCSIEGFEGIRAQDILPELLKRFRFERYYAYMAVADPFYSVGYGFNFDLEKPQDVEFLKRVQELEDEAIDAGVVKPAQMFALMRPLRSTTCPQGPVIWKRRSPERSLRRPDAEPALPLPRLADFGFQNPFAEEVFRPALCLLPSEGKVYFGTKGTGPQILRSNWSHTEEHLVWGLGIESDLEFQASSDIDSLCFGLRPCGVPGGEPRTITVLINETVVATIDVTRAEVIKPEISPAQRLRARERVHIRFVSSRPRRPDLDGGDDARPLSFALFWMELTKAST